MSMIDFEAVRDWLLALQDRISEALEAKDRKERFRREVFERGKTGLHRPYILESGATLEKAAVNFSHSVGAKLPPAATERRTELAGKEFAAASVSLIVHPRNPYAPTTHMNLRCFMVGEGEANPSWWFGGGFDLTPYYGFEEDAVHWHRTAREACAPFGDDLYPACKAACDAYFFLPHRGEARGIGGIFFDDFDRGGFDLAFAFVRSVGDHFLSAYLPIIERRRDHPFGARERAFQLYRRGRYVEFNLLHDRGTRFGLQAGGRTESILASLPPAAHWCYDWKPEPGSAEFRLSEIFLKPRDWASEI